MRAPEASSSGAGLISRCRRIRRHIQKGGFDVVHENLSLTRPRHPKYSLLLWQILLRGRSSRECDHRHICLLRCALAHGAYESLAYTLIHSGSEDQQVRTLEQLVDNPRGVGIE